MAVDSKTVPDDDLYGDSDWGVSGKGVYRRLLQAKLQETKDSLAFGGQADFAEVRALQGFISGINTALDLLE